MDVSNKQRVPRLNVAGRVNAGVLLEGDIDLWELIRGERIQMVEFRLHKGFCHPHHNHPDHESIGYILRGKLKMTIDGNEYVLGASDAWHVGAGIYHSSVALEDTHAVEVHSPPRPEYDNKETFSS